jgi:hypothetical protein
MIDDNGRAATQVIFHFTRLAGIALSVGVVVCAGTLVVLMLATNDKGISYGQAIDAYGLTRWNLGWGFLVFGLAMVSFAGITAWLVSLYSTFRVAGPLFRFSRNLEMEIERGPIAPIPIRRCDQLQREWKEFDAGVAALREHYDQLRQAAKEARQFPYAGATHRESPALAIAQLMEAERRARL